MQRTFKMLALAAVLTMVAPVGAATWMSAGTVEPDTSYDVDGGWMWNDGPANDDSKQVYFNAYSTSFSGVIGVTAVNPNAGALGSKMQPSGFERWYALLGEWRDCNGDGYIGMAEGALQEYRSELLLSNDVCPAGSGPAANTRLTHNDGTWVTELLIISDPRSVLGDGSSSPTNPTDKRAYVDRDARIWGDTGLPGEDAATRGGNTCPISPFPKGTMQSTGGMVQYADCNLQLGDNWNELLVTVDPTNSLGLQLADEDNWNEAGHPLNVGTFGDEDSSRSAATIFDCNAVLYQTTVGGNTITVYEPAPAVRDPNGSPAATVNETMESAPTQVGSNSANCNPNDDAGGDVYKTALNEGEFERNVATNKHQAQWNFQFNQMARGGAPGIVGGLTSPSGTAPQNFGVTGVTMFASYWAADSVTTGTSPALPFRAGLNATDPENPTYNPQVGPAPVYRTFYAYIGNADDENLELPAGGVTGTYGAEWCATATTGVQNGFDCAAINWNTNADGTKFTGHELLAEPGWQYNLRDIDCFDSTVTNAVATWGTCA